MLIKYLFCQFALGTDDIELKDPVGFVVFFCFFFFLAGGRSPPNWIHRQKKKNTSSTVLGKFSDKELGSSW